MPDQTRPNIIICPSSQPPLGFWSFQSRVDYSVLVECPKWPEEAFGGVGGFPQYWVRYLKVPGGLLFYDSTLNTCIILPEQKRTASEQNSKDVFITEREDGKYFAATPIGSVFDLAGLVPAVRFCFSLAGTEPIYLSLYRSADWFNSIWNLTSNWVFVKLWSSLLSNQSDFVGISWKECQILTKTCCKIAPKTSTSSHLTSLIVLLTASLSTHCGRNSKVAESLFSLAWDIGEMKPQ